MSTKFTKKNLDLLDECLKIATCVSGKLDRAYFAHCLATNTAPDIVKDTADYGKKGFSKQ